jgi:hypothetical protein
MAITLLPKAFRGLVCLLLLLLPYAAGAQHFYAERLNGGEPIISAEHFRQLGARDSDAGDINGPSVIRVPDWIPKEQRAASEAQYYLYFAHHTGKYIRLAWAEDIAGPWHLYHTGKLVPPGQRGVLDMGDDRLIPLGGAYAITGHIASPDVHVDDDNKRIVLYFHGGTTRNGPRLRKQRTYVATSPWGLGFSAGIVPVPLSESYLRVFEYNGKLQGLYASYHASPRNNAAPWAVPADAALVGDNLWEIRDARFLQFDKSQKADGKKARNRAPFVRHLALYRQGDRLHVFYTMTGDAPERIYVTSVDLNDGDWFDVAPEVSPAEVLHAEKGWEGAGIEPERSKKGAEYRLVNALRDPYVFNDRGNLYLFYAGGGEQAIGVARLTLQPD